MKKDYNFRTAENNLLRITAFGVENIKSSPCLIFVHGFKGFKDWGFGPYIGEYFGNKGYFVLTFNFSHNGVGDALTEFVELEKFAENTFSLEVRELSQLIDAYLDNFFGEQNIDKIGLAGHSRGGAISLLTAWKKKEVKALAVWSSVSKLNRYTERQKVEWKKKGIFKIFNSRTKQEMKLNLTLLEDIEKNGDNSLNIKKAATELDIPFLIIHGEQDLTVPVQEAKNLLEWAENDNKELFLIPGAGHTFDIKHPFEGSNQKFEKVLSKTELFFKTFLN